VLDWQPTGSELHAAAEHAARKAARYQSLADEWVDETCRLADLLTTEQRLFGRRGAGTLGRIADELGITRPTLIAWRRRRAANGSGG
jgi:hypothetical protein